MTAVRVAGCSIHLYVCNTAVWFSLSVGLTMAPQMCFSLIGNKCKLYLKDDELLQVLEESLNDSR